MWSVTTEACKGSEDQNNLVKKQQKYSHMVVYYVSITETFDEASFELMGFSFKFICESSLQLWQKLIKMFSSGVVWADKENNDCNNDGK